MDEKIKIMIVDDNKEFVKILTTFVNGEDDMEVVGCEYDGLNAVSLIKAEKPDVLLLDIIMPEKDGLAVLEEMNEKLEEKPLVIMMSAIGQEKITQKALSLGALYYVVKPFDLATLTERLRELAGSSSTSAVYERGKSKYSFKVKSNVKKIAPLEVRVTNLIHDVGVPAHIKGYQYLREAIILAVENADIINAVTKTLYPMLAKSFKTTPSRVERAIRHAIEVSWNRGQIEVHNKIFGYTVNSNKGKPTNSEFIAMLADLLRMETVEAREEIAM